MTKKIGNFEVVETRSGGMAFVHKAYDEGLNCFVAIKEPAGHLMAQEKYIERFKEEGKKLAGVDHENIVKVRRFINRGEIDDKCYLVMDWVDYSLEDVIGRERISPEMGIEVLRKLLEGLRAIHQKGFVHRDIKPSNVLVSADGSKIKIGDFGISIVRGKDEPYSPTAEYSKYIAPEILMEEPASPQSDLYSLGLVAYYMFLGRDRFYAEFNEIYRGGQVETQIENTRWVNWHLNPDLRARPLSQVDPSIDPRVSAIVEKLMEKDPSQRTRNTDEALSDIARLRSASGPSMEPPLDTRDPKSFTGPEKTKGFKGLPMKKKLLYGGLGIYIVLMILLFVLLSTAKDSGSLRVDTTPSGAIVYLDGVKKGEAPLTIAKVSAGIVKVRVEWPAEGDSQERDVEIRAKQEAGESFVLPPKVGALRVETNPAGAAVFVEGAAKGNAPLVLSDMPPGKIGVAVELDGYIKQEQTLEVQAGQEAVAAFTLEPVPKPKLGSLRIETKPAGGTVLLDGAERGKAPLALAELPAGSVNVEVTLKGYEKQSKTLEIEPGTEALASFELKELPPVAGDLWQDPATGMEFVWVPTGCFKMGSPPTEKYHLKDEEPVHEVCVDGFWIGKTEVTVEQFKRFVQTANYRTDAEKEGYAYVGRVQYERRQGNSWQKNDFIQDDKHPVVNVSWNDASTMAEWLSKQGLGQFRLPTEAEWEYAARAGSDAPYSWGSNPQDMCTYANGADKTAKARYSWKVLVRCDDRFPSTAPVMSFQPNRFGLYDMTGNVWEWCHDAYGDQAYNNHQRENPMGAVGGALHVTRGGSWYSDEAGLRSAARNKNQAGERADDLGFRLVRKP